MKTKLQLCLSLTLVFAIWGVASAQYVYFRSYNSSSDTYEARDTFPARGVADDYGPRRHGPLNWHGGIDYNDWGEDYGHLILAPQEGTIVDVNRLLGPNAPASKEIALDVGNYRYLFIHVFHNSGDWLMSENNNTIIAKSMYGAENNERWAMIMNVNDTLIVIGQTNGFVIHNGDTLAVTNSVTQYSPIGPLGTSGSVLAHLHLNTIPDNQTGWSNAHNKNPLEYVNYRAPQYNIQLFSQSNANSINLNYPGAAASPVCIRPNISEHQVAGINNRYYSVYDINQVEALIKKTYEAQFMRIKGAQMESFLSLGGRIGTDVINHTREQYAGGHWGNWDRTGINSYAYNSANAHPYDDFYFTDFITRIHKDDPIDGDEAMLSYCPMSTRYNDGRYHIKARVTNVRNTSTDSPVQNVVIDNYKPFIREVKAQVNNQVIYRRTWQCDDGAGCQGMRLTQLQTVPDILKLTAHLPLSSNLPIPTGVILVCKP